MLTHADFQNITVTFSVPQWVLNRHYKHWQQRVKYHPWLHFEDYLAERFTDLVEGGVKAGLREEQESGR